MNISFGIDGSFNAPQGKYNTASDILNDSGLAALLGFDPANVDVYQDGARVTGTLDQYSDVQITTKSCEKGR